MLSWRRLTSSAVEVPLALVVLSYAIVGAVVYGSTLTIFFLSDDFEFLDIVAAAGSVWVIFEPLVGRFVRPFVVLTYYLNYQAIGLAPWGYHLTVLLVHLLASCLVFAVACRLGGPESRAWAWLAGLLFLVFSGHSEAVSWVAGIADPLVTVCLLTAFVAYLRSLEPGASAWWLGGMLVTLIAAALSKEMWVVFPAWLVLHAALLAPPSTRSTRAGPAVAITVLLVAGYLLGRQAVFGSVSGGYSGLGSSLESSIFWQQARAFVIRSFVPAGSSAAILWQQNADLVIAPVLLAVLAWSARGRQARVLAFSGLAFLASLAPVLPLTISVVSTESERYVYLATALSSIFVVWAFRSMAGRPRPAAMLCVAAIVVHATALVRVNELWRDAGTLARNIIDSYAEQVLVLAPAQQQSVFILNLPDSLAGAYVFRRGFYPAVELGRPEAASLTGRTIGVASQTLYTPEGRARVERTGEKAFRIDLASGRIVQPVIPDGWHYRIVEQSPTGYDIEFGDAVGSALVLYLTGGKLEAAGTIVGPGLPFGHVDLPAATDASSCDGESIRLAGWALDDGEVTGVSVWRLPAAGEEPLSRIGDATWMPGERPDVAAIFPAYPNATRAGWEFRLPCGVVDGQPEGTRVRITAHDDAGNHNTIGERVFPPR